MQPVAVLYAVLDRPLGGKHDWAYYDLRATEKDAVKLAKHIAEVREGWETVVVRIEIPQPGEGSDA